MAPSQSKVSATIATITAPTMSTGSWLSFRPELMVMPSAPPPIRKASVAMPMLRTIAVRTPARITGTASGSSMRVSTSRRVMPMPRPASMTLRSTPSRPTIVLRSTGSSAKSARQ